MEALLLHQVEHLQQALPCHARTTRWWVTLVGVHDSPSYEEGQRTRIAHMRHRLLPSVRRWSDRLQLLRLLPDTMTGGGLELLAKQAHALVPPRVAVVVVSLVPGPLGGRGRGGRKE